jgi:hypothetical protein
MNLIATMYGVGEDEWGGRPAEDIEVEFEDVKEVHRDDLFFTVIKNNGDQHATRISKIKKFILINN